LAIVTAMNPDTDVMWIGSQEGLERDLVTQTGLQFEAVPGGQVVGVGVLRAMKSLMRMAKGTLRALTIVRCFRPDVLLTTGGWVTVPVTLAAWLRRVPIVIFLPDIEPGSAIRALSRFATRIATVTDDSARYLRPGLTTTTGYPVRPSLLQAAGYDSCGQSTGPAQKVKSAHSFGLDPAQSTVLVMGGSRGARSINEALKAILPDLLPDCQIIHISGTLDWPWVSELPATLPDDLRARYSPHPYLHDEAMANALAAADVVVSRAGAGVLGEFTLFGLPAILVPYPHAWRYQKVNADYLANHGAAVHLTDDQLAGDLLPTLRRLLGNEAMRSAMAANARALAVPDAARRVVDLLAALGETPAQESRGTTT
jgi:UDP-N-acetylglucosamine--N-acetylmuramyl-(pentapeptide) pyrophosphoryl-undecaprenol N-acetylglucosamine transferase